MFGQKFVLHMDNKNNNKIYDIEDIYEWIDYVRKMGIEQSFKGDV